LFSKLSLTLQWRGFTPGTYIDLSDGWRFDLRMAVAFPPAVLEKMIFAVTQQVKRTIPTVAIPSGHYNSSFVMEP